MQLAGVQIGAEDVAGTIASYATLLEVPASPRAGGGARFMLERGTVDVVAGTPGLQAVRFVVAPDEAPPPPAYGVMLVTDTERSDSPTAPAAAIDHVVVNTTDPERAIALWR